MNFGGRGGMGNMSQMLKQAQAMQAKMMQAQEELKQARVEGSAGGGMVSATVNGQGELVSVKLTPEVVNPDACISCAMCATMCPDVALKIQK